MGCLCAPGLWGEMGRVIEDESPCFLLCGRRVRRARNCNFNFIKSTGCLADMAVVCDPGNNDYYGLTIRKAVQHFGT